MFSKQFPGLVWSKWKLQLFFSDSSSSNEFMTGFLVISTPLNSFFLSLLQAFKRCKVRCLCSSPISHFLFPGVLKKHLSFSLVLAPTLLCCNILSEQTRNRCSKVVRKWSPLFMKAFPLGSHSVGWRKDSFPVCCGACQNF